MSTPFTDPASLPRETLERGTSFAPRFDAHGLIGAITVSATTGEVLMFAFMNAEALRLTLETGEAHYYSRSRRGIWRKGETSGEIQKVREVRTDCDQDVILLRVDQTGRGAACHTGRRSCFFRKVEMADGEAVLADTEVPQLFDPADVYGS